MNEETIFAAALEKKSRADREAYLADACRGNAPLRAAVEELLSASAAAGSYFEHPPAGLDVTIDAGGAQQDTHKSAGWNGSLAFLSPCDKPDRIGRLVGNAGEYEIIEVVGSGGMGVVLRAFDTKLSRIVAVKVLAPELALNPTAVKRFLREAKAAAAVVHDHVVTIHNVEESHQPPFLVMQFVEGQTLQQKIDRQGALELKEILRIGCQAAAGLAAAHKHGLVHRDVKPANILLENGVERVKITDFGLARAGDDVEITQAGLIAGTPQYMSPEQTKGEPVDARSDLFSLGSVLYTMCAGRPAFRAETTMGVLRRVCDDAPRPIHELNAELPPWLEGIVHKLLAKNPDERFQTAAEVSDLLGQCLAHVQNPASVPLPADKHPPVALATKAVSPAPQPVRMARAAVLIAVLIGFAVLMSVLLAAGVASMVLARYLHDSQRDQAIVENGIAPPEESIPIGSSADILTSADWEWTAPENLGPILNTSATEGGPTLSRDGLTLIFHSDRQGGLGGKDLWSSTRESLSERWTEPVNLGQWINSPATDSDPVLSADGLTLLFSSNRFGGQGGDDLWICTRADRSEPWSVAGNLAAVNRGNGEQAPALSADGLALIFNSYRSNHGVTGDLWISTRPARGAGWSEPRNMGTRINSPAFQGFAALADDGLSLIFNSNRGGGPWSGPLHICTRTSPQGKWSEPRPLWDDSLGAWSACLSADSQTILFDSKRTGGLGGFDLWMARRVRKGAVDERYAPLELQSLGNEVVSRRYPELKPGRLTHQQVPFEIGTKLVHLSGSGTEGEYPQNVAGIVVDRPLARLHVLHATQAGAGRDTPVAKYKIHYGDGTTVDWTILHGRDVDGYLVTEQTRTDNPAARKVAYTGQRYLSGDRVRPVRLYYGAWENPSPEKHVASIDFHSLGTKAAPFCVAMTVESPGSGPGWESLFNGRDLAGWKPHPGSSTAWTVKDNLLVGRGANQYLYTARGDYRDFHLRAEVKLHAAGDSGILVRMAPPAEKPIAETGYEVQLVGDPNHSSPAGTIIRHGASVTGKDAVPPGAKGRGDLIRPGEWFNLEITAIGGQLSVAIDGQQVVSYRDDSPRTSGHIALQSFSEATEVSFRKIEIKEFSPGAERPAESSAVAQDKPTMKRWKLFDPATDKPTAPPWADQEETVQVEDGAWRLENNTSSGNFHVLMATVLDDLPTDGIVVCRAKIKLEVQGALAGGNIRLGDWEPDHYGYRWPEAKYHYRGNVTEWTEKEIRYPATDFQKVNPPQIAIYFGLHNNGVLWVKDLELLHIPAGRTAPAAATGNDSPSRGEKAPVQPAVTSRSSLVFSGPAAAGGDVNVFAVGYSPRGELAATGHYGGPVHVWNPATGEPVTTLAGHERTVSSISFASGGKLLATGGEDGVIHLWNTQSWEKVATLSGHTGRVHTLEFRDDDAALISVSLDFSEGGDNTIRRWDVASHSESSRLNEFTTDHHSHAAISPDGSLAAVAHASGRVRLWDLSRQAPAHDFSGFPTGPCSVAFSRDGSRVAAGFLAREGGPEWNDPENAVVRMWDVESGALVQEFRGHSGPVIALEFAPDDRQLLSLASDRFDARGELVVSSDRSIRIWNVETGREEARIEPSSRVNVARWSPQGDAVCSGVRLWNVAALLAAGANP